MTAVIDTSPLDRHDRAALLFSGGKDSLAVAHLLRPFWDRITLYHVDAGDLLPEVRAIVDAVAAMVPRFERITTDSGAWTRRIAEPSDLVPMTATLGGVALGGRPLVDRYTCCWHNIMKPAHERMLADGIGLVIRGTKRCDTRRMASGSGDTSQGYELWLPIQEWSHDEVFAYLRGIGAPVCRVYEHRINAPECATCPAWWDEGRARYLKAHHPDLFAAYAGRLRRVAAEVAPVWRALAGELAELEQADGR